MRQWTEIIQTYAALTRGKPYRVKVKDVRKKAKPRAMEIDLEFLDGSQQGRRLTIELPLPVRPGSLTASYLIACGLAVVPEATVTPRDTIDTVLAARFEKTANGENWHATDFQKTVQMKG